MTPETFIQQINETLEDGLVSNLTKTEWGFFYEYANKLWCAVVETGSGGFVEYVDVDVDNFDPSNGSDAFHVNSLKELFDVIVEDYHA